MSLTVIFGDIVRYGETCNPTQSSRQGLKCRQSAIQSSNSTQSGLCRLKCKHRTAILYPKNNPYRLKSYSNSLNADHNYPEIGLIC